MVLETGSFLSRLGQRLRRRSLAILVASVSSAALAILGGFFVYPPTYTSTIHLYVTPPAGQVWNGDKANNPARAYGVILKDDSVMNVLSQLLLAEYTEESLRQLVPFESPASNNNDAQTAAISMDGLRDLMYIGPADGTEVLEVSVSSRSGIFSARICNLLSDLAPDLLTRVAGVQSVELVGEARSNIVPTSPSALITGLAGFLTGLLLSICIVLSFPPRRKRISSQEELEEHFPVPFLGSVPDMTAASSRRRGAKRDNDEDEDDEDEVDVDFEKEEE